MKNNNFSKLNLFKPNFAWWILGLVLAFPVMFFLDYFAGRIYPKIHTMEYPLGYALIQQLRLELIVLAFFNVITPVVINAIEIFYNDLIQNGDRRDAKQPYFKFSFDLAGLKRPIPYMLAVSLIVAEKAFIISLMMYLRENYYNALNNSMDFLLGAPYLTIIVASLLLVIDCFLIFCLLLFSFFGGYSWVQWVSDKVFPKFSNTKNYPRTLLLFSLIFRALNMLGLAFVINFMATFSGKFNTAVNIIFGITILLFLWVGMYVVPFLREIIASKKKIAV